MSSLLLEITPYHSTLTHSCTTRVNTRYLVAFSTVLQPISAPRCSRCMQLQRLQQLQRHRRPSWAQESPDACTLKYLCSVPCTFLGSLYQQLALKPIQSAALSQSGCLPPANGHSNGGNYMMVWSWNEQQNGKRATNTNVLSAGTHA